jgi:anti-sigma-K factor RskA
MIDADDIDGLAGEYVLGTLDAGERASVAARRSREPALNAAIQSWERRLAALSEAVPAVTPPSGLLPKIEARLDGVDVAPAGSATILDLRRRVSRWRTAAAIASALAATLALTIGIREFAPKQPAQNLVAILQKDAASPAFLVTVNVDNRVMTVRPVSAKPEAGKSHELWIIHDSLGKPKSLGIVDDPAQAVKPELTNYKSDVIQSSTYAITLEPEGGSPSGDPTGPVVFSGKMLPAGDF